MSDIIYLYLKTHNKTGLKYLGKTIDNPFTYIGSGKYWKRHINKHGDDVTTKILFSTDSKNALKLAGLYYSELWNIVESKSFANIVPESGDGGDTSEHQDYKSKTRNKKCSDIQLEAWNDNYKRKKYTSSYMKKYQLQRWEDKSYRIDTTQKIKNTTNTKSWKENHSHIMKEVMNRPVVKEKISGKNSHNHSGYWIYKEKIFELSEDMALYLSIPSSTVRNYCKNNNDKVIIKSAYTRSLFLQSLGSTDEVVGKTYNEIGFNFARIKK